MKLDKQWAVLFMLSLGLTSGNAAPRIAIAGISHETNSFNLTKATLADFEGEDALSENRKEWLETNAKTNQNAAGMIAGAEKYGLELFPIHFFNAVPRGPIDERSFNTMVDRILQGLKQPPGYDGCAAGSARRDGRGRFSERRCRDRPPGAASHGAKVSHRSDA